MKIETRTLLSTSWIFLTVNFIFCDVFTLMHAEDLRNLLEGKAGDMEITQEFLLAFAIIMEIPMLMILLSRMLPRRINRMLNLVAGIFLAFIQTWSLTVGEQTLHYVFFSIVEIATLLYIVWTAWRWRGSTS